MSLSARLQLDQRTGDRSSLAASATLRDATRRPHDVQIDDLSRSGCHVATLLPLELGMSIKIGIPGIGSHALHVIRETEGGYGCAFARPLTDLEVSTALAARQDQVVYPAFSQEASSSTPRRLTPPGLIGGIIVSAVALSWLAVGLLAKAFGIF